MDRWASRRVPVLLLRLVILFAPVLAAVVAASAVSRVVREPSNPAGQALWLAMVAVVSTVVLMASSHVTRRFLPLAALLRLSLVFPDRAPSRFRSAMRMGSVRMLEQRLQEARDGGLPGESLDDAALRVVELATALRLHDRRTRGHCERVRVYADMIGREMGLSKQEREKLHWAALLHDVGKLEVPAEILNKKGKPSSDE